MSQTAWPTSITFSGREVAAYFDNYACKANAETKGRNFSIELKNVEFVGVGSNNAELNLKQPLYVYPSEDNAPDLDFFAFLNDGFEGVPVATEADLCIGQIDGKEGFVIKVDDSSIERLLEWAIDHGGVPNYEAAR